VEPYDGSVESPGYLRFPHIIGDLAVFIAADDVWLAPVAGGRAWRFTTDEARPATPRLSPDGTHVAWVSAKDGSPEIYVASLTDGTSTRLTYWGTHWARVSGWTPAGEVLAVTAANQPFRHYVRARALTTELSGSPGAERVLPFGPVSDLSLGTDGHGISGDSADGSGAGVVGLLTGTWGVFGDDPAHWKRYRGGTAGRLWTGPATAIVSGVPGAAGQVPGPFRRVLADLPTQFASPMIVGGRLAFISDHEGTGNIYSCAPDGSDLRRHTDHEGWYAHQASTDGRRIVYARGGELWLLDDLQAAGPVRLDVTLGSPARGRAPRLVTAEDHVGSLSVDHGGRASAIEVRGTVHWLTHRDGPARAVSVVPGVRARFPQVLGTGGQVIWATDADGVDALEIGSGDPARSADPAAVTRPIAVGQVGRVTGLAAAPDGRKVAVASLDGRLRTVDVESGEVREIAASDNGVVSGLAWSPDSAWLAWSQPTEQPIGGNGTQLRRLRLARFADGQVFDATDGRFDDSEPVFTLDGKYLAFLSMRDFDPVYDAHFFDLTFPYGARPFLLPLDAATPSPFAPELGGRPIGEPADKPAGGGGSEGAGGATDGAVPDGDRSRVPAVSVETTGMTERVVAVPVAQARYSRLRAVKDGLAWLHAPVTGELGTGGARPDDDATRPALERFDLVKREVSELAGDVDWFEASGDGTRLVTSDHGKLTVIPAERKADDDSPDDKIEIDRTRARFLLDPPAMWRQAYAEAGRIVRHEFWVADMADVDWDAVLDEYRPLLDRITTGSEFNDLLWEIFGEHGTSHGYADPPEGDPPAAGLGLLGADLERSGDTWRLTRVVRGDTSDPRARAPLAAPGAGIVPGDALLAVDGRAIGPDGPGPLLTGAAGKPVELTIAPADGSRPRSVPVVPLKSDTRLRYLDWVSSKRAQVRELSEGRLGYLHVPDMVGEGWADFSRDLRREMVRDALIVDVRGNTGGHTSQLVVEKLARRVIAWDVRRGMKPSTYPEDAPRGPVVALTDECSGSDGDIVTGAIRLLQLGPVVGARTWGGVVGYDDMHELIDGTKITVPKLAFWFEQYGWGVENYGVDPDVEVIMSPDDWAAGRDTQLETAVRLALEALQQRPAVRPPDIRTRPSRRRPPLPPRA
jgi:tricorn protease